MTPKQEAEVHASARRVRYRMYRITPKQILLCCILLLSSCVDSPSPESAESVSGSKSASDARTVDWLHYGNTHSEQRFGELDQVNAANVSRLGLAWSQEIPGARSLQATPLAVAGVLYYTTDEPLRVYAVNAANGEIRWVYQTESETPDSLRLSLGQNRGVGYSQGKVYVGVGDGRLVALDATTGREVWSARTFDKGDSRYISGAPRVFDGKVIIGHGGGDTGERGYVSTYDTETGALLWRFWIVPGNPADGFESKAMEMAAKTWNGEYWKYGHGGTAWNGITYDPEFNRVYIGTGNSGPYSPEIRSPGGNGDNLFLCSIVALDAKNGEYIWHYQVNPREAWDYKATMDIVLADLEIDGQPRKVLMQAPTNGFFYVIDRETGKLISAEKYGGKVNWASHIDLETGRPVERENIRYEDGEPEHMWPGTFGAHNYQPMSYNPQTGLVYIPHMEAGMIMGTVTPEEYEINPVRTGYKHVAQTGATFGGMLTDSENGGKGSIIAYDPVAQKEVWREVTDSYWNGGTLTTAGNLAFYATAKGMLNAYNARTGEKLWAFNLGLGAISAPMTYAVDGIQYIALLVGYGGSAGAGIPEFRHGWKYGAQPRRLLAFKLDGAMELPETAPPSFDVSPVIVEGFQLDAKKVSHGAVMYHSSCSKCHGGLLAAESVAPDLRESERSANFEWFRAVVQEGVLAARGMPLYDDFTDEDVEGMYHYVRYGAMSVGAETPPLDMQDCTFCGMSN